MTLSNLLRRERRSSDVAYLRSLHRQFQLSSDNPILATDLEIAADRTASIQARVSAMVALARARHPEYEIEYEHVTGKLVQDLLPPGGCRGSYYSGDYSRTSLGRSDLAQIKVMARSLFQDKRQPDDVRTAAYCLLH